MSKKGTKIIVDISSIPRDISLPVLARMIEDKVLLLQVEDSDRDKPFNQYSVENTEAMKEWTVYYKSKLTQEEYTNLISKYE